MTKKELRKRTRELIRESAKSMREYADKAINSGNINYKNWDERYLLPKLLLSALLMQEQWRYEPPENSHKHFYKKVIKKIYAHL